MRTVTVEVTADDIRYGIPLVCAMCPVARALDRATDDAWHVGATIARRLPIFEERVDLPRSAQQFIHDFDAGSPVQPFSFELTIPS